VRVIVPAEGGASLSNERAAKLRDHLYTRGVLVNRIVIGAPTTRALVRLQMQMQMQMVPAAAAAVEAALKPPASR
jgi:hypothetical protein